LKLRCDGQRNDCGSSTTTTTTTTTTDTTGIVD
jgi:hypothetical protein